MPQELRQPTASSANGWSRLWPLLLLALIWQLLAMQLHSRALPTPLAVLAVLGEAVTAGDLPFHLGKTLLRVGISFVLAMLLGVALGIL
ncbi:MAG: hypothetical protein ORN29_06270, partial [Rhodoferax sp.]|nr:hypothetical protein [Rhodoferax sp.]